LAGPGAFKVYPFTPGENHKAKFDPFSPATVGKRRCDYFLGQPRGLILTISFDVHQFLVVFGSFGIRFWWCLIVWVVLAVFCDFS
jgi:hypothetical protein